MGTESGGFGESLKKIVSGGWFLVGFRIVRALEPETRNVFVTSPNLSGIPFKENYANYS